MTAVLAAATPASLAQHVTFTISDAPITGTPDAPQVFEFFCPFSPYEFGPFWTIDAEIFDPSFGSELNLVLTHESGYALSFDGSDGNAHDLGPADVDLGFGDAPGRWTSNGMIDIYNPAVLPSVFGVWTVSVFDEHDSLPGPEGTLDAAFTVWMPTPGSLTCLAVGLACARRRRSRA